MKLYFTCLLLPLVGAFQAQQQPLSKATTTTSITQLDAVKNPMGDILKALANNFEPIHGHGSLEKDLEEQWEAQQQLLKDRQTKNIDKEHLKQKYKNPDNVKFDLKVGLQDGRNTSNKKRKNRFSF